MYSGASQSLSVVARTTKGLESAWRDFKRAIIFILVRAG